MATATLPELACPKCGGRMWDNRATKRNPKAPDYKCRDNACDGVIWPGQGSNSPKNNTRQTGNGQQSNVRNIRQTPTEAGPPVEGIDPQVYVVMNECADFVLRQIVPKLLAADIGVDAMGASALISTCVNQRCKERA